jgi:predicted small metal-binding protein
MRRVPARVFHPKNQETIMSRKYIDCREYPGDIKCTVALCADTEEELLEAAVRHAVDVHKYEDSAELRNEIRSLFKDGTPPLEAPVVLKM